MLINVERFWITCQELNLKLGAVIVGLCMTLASARVGCAERLEPYRCGSVLEDAKCFLRSVLPYGALGRQPRQLPAPLEGIIGQPVVISAKAFRTFLVTHRVDESSLGGMISEPLSKTRRGDFADYFVIHDTSTPAYANHQEFPAFIDEAGWNQKLLRSLVRRETAHVFVDRTGQSKTSVDFASPLRTTLFEKLADGSRRGLFLGVELIQPRKLDARGIDAIAPLPGFTEAQLDRLALTYVAASIRRGRWMIPAFHAAIDFGLYNAHDDPQNFDLKLWSQRLQLLLATILK